MADEGVRQICHYLRTGDDDTMLASQGSLLQAEHLADLAHLFRSLTRRLSLITDTDI